MFCLFGIWGSALEGERSGWSIYVSGTFNFEHHACVLLACVRNFNALNFNANQFPRKTGSQPWQRNNRCRFSIRQSPPCCWQCHNGFVHQQPSTSQTTPSTQWFHCISIQFIFVQHFLFNKDICWIWKWQRGKNCLHRLDYCCIDWLIYKAINMYSKITALNWANTIYTGKMQKVLIVIIIAVKRKTRHKEKEYEKS